MTATDGYFAAGAILQIAGVAEVAWEVAYARRRFRRRRVALRGMSWTWLLVRRLFQRPRTWHIEARTLSVSNVTARLDIHRAAPSPSVEQQVAELSTELQALRDEIRVFDRRLTNLEQGASATAERLGDLRSGLSAARDELERIVGDIATGGLRLIGVAMIVTGIAFEAWPWFWPDRQWAALLVFVGLVAGTL